MSNELTASVDKPIGAFEYQLTADLAAQAAVTLFDLKVPPPRRPKIPGIPVNPFLLVAIVSIQLVAGIVALILFCDWNPPIAPTLWLLIIAAVLVQVILVLKVAVYLLPPLFRWYVRRKSLRYVKGMLDQTVRWRLFEERIETELDTTNRRVLWTEMVQVRITPQFWFLMFRPKLELLIPASILSNELQLLIRRKADEVHAKILEPRSNVSQH